MNDHEEQALAARFDRELKHLPNTPAPATLAPRVMAAIRARVAAPWYRQNWTVWPLSVRLAVFALLATGFGGLCYLSSVPRSLPSFAPVENLLRAMAGLWTVATTLANTASLLFRQIDPRIVTGCLVSLILAYALFLSVTSACVRLAFVRR